MEKTITTEEIINGLKHMADDHPCCRLSCHMAKDRLKELHDFIEEITPEIYNQYGQNSRLINRAKTLTANSLFAREDVYAAVDGNHDKQSNDRRMT